MNRLLFICSSLDTGGAQRRLSNIVCHLPKSWVIDIILNSDDKIQYPYQGNIISLGVKEPSSRQSILYQIKIFFRRYDCIKKLKKENEYNACISFLDSGNIINIIAREKNSKTIITAAIVLSKMRSNFIYRYFVFPLVKCLYNMADVFVVQTEEEKSDYIDNFGINEKLIKVIPNGIDIKSIKRIISNYAGQIEEKWFNKGTIVTVGRLSEQKGQWHLIKAFYHIHKVIPDAKLVIFGEGELRNLYEEFIEKLELEKCILLYHFEKDVQAYINRCGVFVMSSLYEGFPNALLEAMACGVACVVTDFEGGAREIIGYEGERVLSGVEEGKYGLITPQCSDNINLNPNEIEKEEKILAEAIIRLLKDEAYRQKFSAKAISRSRDYDIDEAVIPQWMKLLDG